MKAQHNQHHVNLKLNVNVFHAHKVDHKDLSEFLNSNKIIELDIDYLNDELIVDDSFYGSLRFLKIH
jgi:hypothetical protein